MMAVAHAVDYPWSSYRGHALGVTPHALYLSLGDSQFRSRIASQLGRRDEPLARGGDHKSAVFRNSQSELGGE